MLLTVSLIMVIFGIMELSPRYVSTLLALSICDMMIERGEAICILSRDQYPFVPLPFIAVKCRTKAFIHTLGSDWL